VNTGGNAMWLMLSQGTRVVGQFVGIVVLSRLLLPQDFGTMAMAMTAIAFATLFRELGIPAALIQRRVVDSDDLWTAFVAQVSGAFAIGAVLFFAAPAIAAFLGSHDAVPVMRLLAISFPLSGLGNVQQAMLEREGRFRKIAVVEILATLTGLVVAVVMATANQGVTSLAFQNLAAVGLSTAGFWFGGTRLSAGKFNLDRLKGMLGFGGELTLFNLVNFFSRNADNIVVGKQLGQSSLGLYSQAYKVMLFPVQNLTLVAGRALYPSLCKDQDNPYRFWDSFLKVSGMVAMVSAPILLGIVAFREEFVRTIFGPRWSAVAPLLLWLGPTGCLQAQVSLTGTAFTAKGRTDLLLRVGVLSAATQVASFLVGIHWGLQGLVRLYLLSNLVNAMFILGSLFLLLGGTWRDYLRQALPPYALAATVFLGGRTIVFAIGTGSLSQTTRWIFLATAAVYILALHMVMPQRINEFRAAIGKSLQGIWNGAR
jgi:PST family polysaccharide transporter